MAGIQTPTDDPASILVLPFLPDRTGYAGEGDQRILYYDCEWAEARDDFRRALQLNPGNSDAHQAYDYYPAALGRFDEIIGEMECARELDPRAVIKISGLGDVLLLAWGG